MTDRIFIDTNLWVYLFSDDIEKRRAACELIRDNFKTIQVSSQVLGELFNVLTKKNITGLEKAQKIVDRISNDFFVLSIDKEIVKDAITLKLRYGYSYWDSLIIASALKVEARILYSEDLHHNHTIENELRILNPFVTLPHAEGVS
jgi:predicted nucleic acid-binding protein